jgi:hypothetical protein
MGGGWVESKRGDEETTSMVLPFKFLTKIYDYIRETSITTCQRHEAKKGYWLDLSER